MNNALAVGVFDGVEYCAKHFLNSVRVADYRLDLGGHRMFVQRHNEEVRRIHQALANYLDDIRVVKRFKNANLFDKAGYHCRARLILEVFLGELLLVGITLAKPNVPKAPAA